MKTNLVKTTAMKRNTALLVSLALSAANVSHANVGHTTVPTTAAVDQEPALITNQQVAEQLRSDWSRTQLVNVLERAEVAEQLRRQGVSASDVQRRVAALTDAEVAALNEKMAQMPAGQSALGIIAVVFIAFVITDALGVTDVFPFVDPI